jgi:hypothetical protein
MWHFIVVDYVPEMKFSWYDSLPALVITKWHVSATQCQIAVTFDSVLMKRFSELCSSQNMPV